MRGDEMLGLIQFLKASGVAFDPSDTKIHLACWNGREHPIDIYYAGKFQAWQEHQGRNNFKGAYVLGLIDLGAGHWLFAGLYQVLSNSPHPSVAGTVLYSTSLITGQDDLVGRIVVEHHRTRQSYIWCNPKGKPEIKLPILEIRRKKMSIEEFPGYNAIRVSHKKLQIITSQKISSWHAALSKIKGVYLILDTSTGRPYVGKASGSDGIWQRWCQYADNGHGGDVELRRLLQERGAEHAGHFQYSILEIADTHATDDDILKRESYWMAVLKSREFGLNGSRRSDAQGDAQKSERVVESAA